MNKVLIIFIFLIIPIWVLQAQKIDFVYPDKGIVNWIPAPSWEQTSLLGNGQMGAAVFGDPHNETIILTHSAIYLPVTYPFNPINQAARLSDIQKLIAEGNGEQAALIPVEISKQDGYPGLIWNDPFIPAFDLTVKTTAGNIEKYQRSVNFETGESVVTWQQNGETYQRRQFISRSDSFMVLQITGTKPFKATFGLKQRPVNWDQWNYINENIKFTSIKADNNHLYYHCEFVKQWNPNIIGYIGDGYVKYTDGEVHSENNQIQVENANNIIFLLKVEPYYFNQQPAKSYLNLIFSKAGQNYDSLLQAHIKVHAALFNRVKFNLNGNPSDKTLFGEVMMQQAKERIGLEFIEKQFYAARYNILSATGKMPPNLQGIWSNSWTPPWSSNFTHDGNLPVAISSFLSSNMPELMHSYFNYHHSLLPYYRENAKKLYNCRGIMVPAHSSSHGRSLHFDKTWCLTFWYGGAAWVSHFYFDYWLYTNDLGFLKNKAYPFMKENALFYEDFLKTERNGKFVFNPSYSPENNPGNNISQATINATMDIALAKELFRNLIAAGELLGENKEQLSKWNMMLSKMPAYETDTDGAFREWLWPGYTENHQHRHLSQLYGMYDRIDPEINNNPVLWQGVKKTLNERMKVRVQDGGGIMVFGLVQLAWVAQNVGDATMSQEIINWISSQYWSNSLATYHDPNGLFNMDLSGGFQSVIIKALLYSDTRYLHVFPAKPALWKSGSISGILARNQLKINNLEWDENHIILELYSDIDQNITLEFPSDIVKVTQVLGNGTVSKIDVKTSTCNVKIFKNQLLNIQLFYK